MEEIQMTSKEMKLAKFEAIIVELAKKTTHLNLGFGGIKYRSNPLELLFGEDVKDEYAIIAMKYSFDNLLIDTNEDYSNVKKLINVCKSDYYYIMCGHIIFFGLIVLSIDGDAYNEKLNVLTDFAYIVGFKEDMMCDWIYVVKSVLSTELIDFSKIKTEKAKLFFENFN